MNQSLLEKFVHNYELKLKEVYRNCDTYRLTEYNAAVKIQAWFRGIRIRCYLKLLEKCTIIIQKTWRGYLGRKQYRLILSKTVIEYRRNKFSKAAAKIQSAWKGYLTRKYIFNFYSRKVYLSALVDVGEFVKNQLSEYEKEMKYVERKEKQEKERDRIINWAKSHHFLVSTCCQPGIYQNPMDKTFYTGHPPSTPYERSLWTTSVYGSIPYGTKHFRASEDENNSAIHKQPKFRNILPPIPLFDKFNREYIPGYATG
ncbi:unnamed protein product [Schistosoma intercalatum]|nr:unnamed protein product [Schistosoma intercalatum]CAH8656404.1 unnamed protein product [Schistosoma intercalatum]